MQQMGWTFDQLEATPHYVKAYSADFLEIVGRAQADANDRASRGH